MALVVAGGAALRLADLGNRPMHCDEANQAVKFGRLLERGEYIYDPREHHGPTLNYLTLPVARAASARKLTGLTEADLRLLPAAFGIVLVALAWFLRNELGPSATVCAAALTALSPAMVFYSRYYIHETLLVCFTFGAMVALWRWAQEAAAASEGPRADHRPRLRQAFWLVLVGLCVGMMHATKETCVIPLFAMAAAAALTMSGLRRLTAKRLVISGLVVLLTAAALSALLFSSFLDNPRGVVDSYTAYLHYLGRASGEGSAGRQAYPFYHYLRILFWWHREGGPVWTEAPIAALALVGLAPAVLGKGYKPANLSMVRFLGIYTALAAVVYSALPYKTPWCAVGFLHGMILLAGVGAAVLVRAMPGYALKAVAVLLLIAAAGHLTWQAYRASFVAYEDPNNPYAYVQTTSDVPRLAERVEQLAAFHPGGKAVHVQVICPDDDYWPLPWYLRGFRRVGWFDRVPEGPPAPIVITQPQMEAALLKYLYVDQPPGWRPLYVPVPPEPEGPDWRLRPNVPLLLWVQRDLWEARGAARS